MGKITTGWEMATGKSCKKCGVFKPLEDFPKHKECLDGREGRCRACAAIYYRKRTRENFERISFYQSGYSKRNRKRITNRQNEKYKNNPEFRNYKWEEKLMKNYSMKISDYEAMRDAQNGKCAICGVIPEKKLNVDHCHKTGKIRELLCGNCNRGIGLLRDNPEIMRSAADYVARHHEPKEE